MKRPLFTAISAISKVLSACRFLKLTDWYMSQSPIRSMSNDLVAEMPGHS